MNPFQNQWPRNIRQGRQIIGYSRADHTDLPLRREAPEKLSYDPPVARSGRLQSEVSLQQTVVAAPRNHTRPGTGLYLHVRSGSALSLANEESNNTFFTQNEGSSRLTMFAPLSNKLKLIQIIFCQVEA